MYPEFFLPTSKIVSAKEMVLRCDKPDSRTPVETKRAMPDQGTEKHSEEADITRDRHPPQIQDNPPVPTRTVRLPLTLERPRENAGQTQVIPASTEPSHSTRKRAAPLSVGGDNGYEADPGSFSGPLSGDSASQVCLCQPEPKIPRPRNGKCY